MNHFVKPWVRQNFGNVEVWTAGQTGALGPIVDIFGESPDPSIMTERLAKVVETWPGHFAVAASDGNAAIAVTDRVRSYPVFYMRRAGVTTLSNDPINAVPRDALELDPAACVELRLANYVTGQRTLFRDLCQVEAGHVVGFDLRNGARVCVKYNSFSARELADCPEDELLERHDSALNATFERVVTEANGRPIWVTLSSGLDSRLVLAKLKALGYENLHCVSYGPPGNDDARGAAEIAAEIGVPWTFVPYAARAVRAFYHSKERSEYWKFASGGASVPFMVDEIAMHQLVRDGRIKSPGETILINGQSGDFTSGGHLTGKHLDPLDPERSYPLKLIVNAIMTKHFSQRTRSGADNLHIDAKIREKLGVKDGQYTGQELAQLYETWESDERQAKYVVNGQRSYDFLGLGWRLPLWDKELFDFWRSVPYHYKLHQRLYRTYLDRHNFMGLFRDRKYRVDRYHGLGRVIYPIARGAGLIGGTGAKKSLYRIGAYFGKYANHYQPFGFWRHLRELDNTHTPLTRYADQLIAELGQKSEGA